MDCRAIRYAGGDFRLAKLRRQLRHMCDLDTGRVIMYAICGWERERRVVVMDFFLTLGGSALFLRTCFCRERVNRVSPDEGHSTTTASQSTIIGRNHTWKLNLQHPRLEILSKCLLQREGDALYVLHPCK